MLQQMKNPAHNQDLKWMLDTNVFLECIKTVGYRVKVHIFASRLNHQLDTYYSYYHDPDALGWMHLPLIGQIYNFI